MPAVRAACGLEPTARNRKPIVERSISHQMNTAASDGDQEARRAGGTRSPSSSGYAALSGMGGLTGLLLPGRWNASRLSRYATR